MQSRVFQDEERVLRLFEGAAEAGVCVEQRHLELHAVLRHVEVAGVALVLTDGGRLRCVYCSVNRLRRLLPWTPSFAGHYVSIVGSHPHNRLVFYRNPAFQDSKFYTFSLGRKLITRIA
jgi:Guanylylate cyclase